MMRNLIVLLVCIVNYNCKSGKLTYMQKQNITNPLVMFACPSEYSHNKRLDGVVQDFYKLACLFNNKFGYKVRSIGGKVSRFSFQTFFKKSIQNSSMKYKDSCIFIFAGYGSKDMLCFSDRRTVNLDEVRQRIMVKLINKPKIFIKLLYEDKRTDYDILRLPHRP